MRTGRLKNSIRKMKPGLWGSDVEYALQVEIRQSYLRSAADQNYPRLVEWMKRELR